MTTHFISYEHLIAYAADELDEAQSAIVADHIATCADCAATVSRFRVVRATIRADDTETPSADTLVRVQNIFPHEPIGKCSDGSIRVTLNSQNTEIEPLLARVLALLCETLGTSAAWVPLLDDRGRLGRRGNFRLAGAHNLPPALEANDRAEMHWSGCACQRKLLAGELMAAVNLVECQRLQRAQGDTRGLRYHASIPLRVRDRTLGLLNLTTPPDRVFGDDELRLLSAFTDQIGVALERARLHE